MDRPDEDEPHTPSRDQSVRRSRFREASAYSKSVMADPLQRKLYQRIAANRKCPTNAMLISNFLNPPTVDLIELADYHGQPGGKIRILATDDIEVVSVDVLIRHGDGTVLEQGAAAKVHGVWIYTATAATPANPSLTIEVVARDRPGNEARQAVTYPR